MSSGLAEAFRSGNGRKVKWQGKTVHSLVRLSVKPADTITVTRLSASKTRAQALNLGVDKGDLRANGVLVPTAAIWTHTAPDQVTVEVVGKRARSIDVWNSWSYEGVESAWLGSSGMLVEVDGTTHTVRCSDGLGEPTFSDLVVTLEITNHG